MTKTENISTWTVGTVNLTQIAEESNWHSLTIIDALEASGMTYQDASDFGAFIMAIKGNVSWPDRYLSADQWNRLDVDLD